MFGNAVPFEGNRNDVTLPPVISIAIMFGNAVPVEGNRKGNDLAILTYSGDERTPHLP